MWKARTPDRRRVRQALRCEPQSGERHRLPPSRDRAGIGEAVIVEAADAISGARPGARRESLEQYIKRVRSPWKISPTRIKGVNQSYALQAGREVRIFVRPEDIDDLASIKLARDIAKKIEENDAVSRANQGDRDPGDPGYRLRQISS